MLCILSSFDEGGEESAVSTVSHILQVARERGTCPLELKAHRDLYSEKFTGKCWVMPLEATE